MFVLLCNIIILQVLIQSTSFLVDPCRSYAIESYSEGKAILMINDMFGINSLGESLRLLTQNTTNKQILIWIWHPMLLTVMDLFQAHRAPFIWHNPGPHYIKYFFNNQKDLFSWDLKGENDAMHINSAMDKGTKLLVMNMIPQHERDCIRIESRIGMGGH